MHMLARNLGQSIGLFARFQKEGFGREEAEHRFAFLGAPVEIEGDGDGADLGEAKSASKCSARLPQDRPTKSPLQIP